MITGFTVDGVNGDQKTNLVSGHQSQQPGLRERGERILDAAAELVLRWGYKRVTVEDVAKRAGIGKGTIYLHWRNREAMFYAVLNRESVAMLDHLLDEIRADPAAVLPHRMLRVLFEDSMRRPLVAGLLTKDTELLGALVERGSDAAPRQDAGIECSREYLRLMRNAGLVRTDLDLERQLHLYAALTNGVMLVQPWLPESLNLPLAAKADAFEYAVRAVFEPATRPDTEAFEAVASQVSALYAGMRDLIAAAVHQGPAAASDTHKE